MGDDDPVREQLELLTVQEKAKRAILALTAVGAVVLVVVLLLILVL